MDNIATRLSFTQLVDATPNRDIFIDGTSDDESEVHVGDWEENNSSLAVSGSLCENCRAELYPDTRTVSGSTARRHVQTDGMLRATFLVRALYLLYYPYAPERASAAVAEVDAFIARTTRTDSASPDWSPAISRQVPVGSNSRRSVDTSVENTVAAARARYTTVVERARARALMTEGAIPPVELDVVSLFGPSPTRGNVGMHPVYLYGYKPDPYVRLPSYSLLHTY